MTFDIISLELEISAICIPYLEQESVDIIAGPPALETITTPLSFTGKGCFEKAVDNSNNSCIVSTRITPDCLKTDSYISSDPINAPVWDIAALAPSGVLPDFKTIIGFLLSRVILFAT